jgi:hypothetical protein
VALAGYAWYLSSRFTLPPSTATSILTTLLPLLSIASTRFSRLPAEGSPWRALLVLLLTTVGEGVLGTLAATHLTPSTCELEQVWRALYIHKNGPAVRTIQDAFECCGFRSLKDMAYPFPQADISPNNCMLSTKRTRSCLDSWQGEEQLIGGLMLLVVILTFFMRIVALMAMTGTFKRLPSWYRAPRLISDEAHEHEARERQPFIDDIEE